MPGNPTAVRKVFEAIATRSGPHLAEKHRPDWSAKTVCM